MPTIDKIKHRLQPVLKKYQQELKAVYLFGSIAEGDSTSLSDVDLAVYVEDPERFSFQSKLMLHGDCCRVLARNDVDLVVMNSSKNLLLLEEIITTGQVVWEKDSAMRIEFEAQLLHRAIDFKEQRSRLMGV